MPTVFQRLLLATEHTAFDAGAETLAMTLAQQCKLPLRVVIPLVSNPEYEVQAPQIAAEAERAAAMKMAQLREAALRAGIRMDLRTRRGQEPYREIVDKARERSSDLIVIRRRGTRGFLANPLLGKMVSKVVAHAPCRVLIVPRDARMWSHRVLVATEPSLYGRRIVAMAARISAECALPLTLVSVAEGNDPTLRQQTDAFVSKAVESARLGGIAAQGLPLEGRPFSEILDAASRSSSDLIVMGRRGDDRDTRALIGGVAQKVIGLSGHPVLLVHFEEPKENTSS